MSPSRSDLQAPLRKINIFSEYLAELEADKLTDEGKDYLGRIQKSTQKMQALVSDLLELSRVSSKLPNFKPISLQQVIENVVSEMSISLQKANGTVQFDALPLIEGDPQQLEQLFVNLLDNAIKFRKPDVAPVVQIAVSPSAEAWNIEFKDNGLGFPQDKAEHIFGIFERLHPSQQYEGTGIGLSIVKRIVERHSGRIVVASEPGQGATFNIHLPMKQITSH